MRNVLNLRDLVIHKEQLPESVQMIYALNFLYSIERQIQEPTRHYCTSPSTSTDISNSNCTITPMTVNCIPACNIYQPVSLQHNTLKTSLLHSHKAILGDLIYTLILFSALEPRLNFYRISEVDCTHSFIRSFTTRSV